MITFLLPKEGFQGEGSDVRLTLKMFCDVFRWGEFKRANVGTRMVQTGIDLVEEIAYADFFLVHFNIKSLS